MNSNYSLPVMYFKEEQGWSIGPYGGNNKNQFAGHIPLFKFNFEQYFDCFCELKLETVLLGKMF